MDLTYSKAAYCQALLAEVSGVPLSLDKDNKIKTKTTTKLNSAYLKNNFI